MISLIAAAALAWSADRPIITAGDLIAACGDQGGAGIAECKGYFDGTISMAMLAREVSYRDAGTPPNGQSDFICPPAGSPTLGEMITLVGAYLVKNPEAREMHAPIAIVNALQDAFPCRPRG